MLKPFKKNLILVSLKAFKSVEGHIASSFPLSGSCHALLFRELRFHDNEITSLALQRKKENKKTLHNYII